MNKTLDLSHIIKEDMPVYPGTPLPGIEKACTHEKDGFAEFELKISSHLGTHIDAPFHIFKNGKTLSDFPVSHFHGKALKISVTKINECIIDSIENKIRRWGKPEFILLHSDWSQYWGNQKYFQNFPLPDAASFKFMAKLGLNGVGIDSISIDPVNANILANHKAVLSKDCIIIENLTNLEHLPEGMFDFFCFPLRIENSDGSPVRAVAEYSN